MENVMEAHHELIIMRSYLLS